MKRVLSVLLVLFLVVVVVDRSYGGRIVKRYYDPWELNHDNGNNGDEEAVKTLHIRHKGKDDPCENKPLWFLKSHANLGKSSPFYDCLSEHGVEST